MAIFSKKEPTYEEQENKEVKEVKVNKPSKSFMGKSKEQKLQEEVSRLIKQLNLVTRQLENKDKYMLIEIAPGVDKIYSIICKFVKINYSLSLNGATENKIDVNLLNIDNSLDTHEKINNACKIMEQALKADKEFNPTHIGYQKAVRRFIKSVKNAQEEKDSMEQNIKKKYACQMKEATELLEKSQREAILYKQKYVEGVVINQISDEIRKDVIADIQFSKDMLYKEHIREIEKSNSLAINNNVNTISEDENNSLSAECLNNIDIDIDIDIDIEENDFFQQKDIVLDRVDKKKTDEYVKKKIKTFDENKKKAFDENKKSVNSKNIVDFEINSVSASDEFYKMLKQEICANTKNLPVKENMLHFKLPYQGDKSHKIEEDHIFFIKKEINLDIFKLFINNLVQASRKKETINNIKETITIAEDLQSIHLVFEDNDTKYLCIKDWSNFASAFLQGNKRYWKCIKNLNISVSCYTNVQKFGIKSWIDYKIGNSRTRGGTVYLAEEYREKILENL